MIKAAIYLAHLNPVTKAHEEIVLKLLRDYNVYVFPVRFVLNNREVNTRSFPFSFEVRKQMIESVFEDKVKVLPGYTFYAPFSKYLPPLLSSKSWELRNQIVSDIEETDFVSYTGDKAERLMLKMYRLNPIKADRLDISASSVKDKMYSEALGQEGFDGWRSMVPRQVIKIVETNWDLIKKFAHTDDKTTRVMGMKFPKEGYK